MTHSPMNLVGRSHSVLNSAADRVEEVDDRLEILACRMIVTLRKFPHGMALAAPQVGQSRRLVVTAAGEVWINPEILEWPDKVETELEGCLSLPNRWFEVPRPTRAVIRYDSIFGKEPTTKWVEGIESRLAFHEIDHLDGLLISKRFPEVRRR